jgi:thioredoxin-like negative regulator of GroEL
MKMGIMIGVIGVVLLGAFVLRSHQAGAGGPVPAVFVAGTDFAKASTMAKESGKPVVVNFSASWCPPCQRMKRDVWTDASVEAFVKQHAVAVYVDVDQDSETAKRFNVQSMPTMVILKGDQEIARTSGGRSADALIAWMERSIKP